MQRLCQFDEGSLETREAVLSEWRRLHRCPASESFCHDSLMTGDRNHFSHLSDLTKTAQAGYGEPCGKSVADASTGLPQSASFLSHPQSASHGNALFTSAYPSRPQALCLPSSSFSPTKWFGGWETANVSVTQKQECFGHSECIRSCKNPRPPAAHFSDQSPDL